MTEQEFSMIVSSTRRAVLGAIRAYLAPALYHGVDDVAQEVYIRIYKYAIKKGSRALISESLSSFAYTIARNESLRFNQKNKANHTALDEGLLEATHLISDADDNDIIISLENAIASLGPDLRPVAEMTFQGYRQSEIASNLGIPEGTVKSRMHKARQLLHEKLEGVYG